MLLKVLLVLAVVGFIKESIRYLKSIILNIIDDFFDKVEEYEPTERDKEKISLKELVYIVCKSCYYLEEIEEYSSMMESMIKDELIANTELYLGRKITRKELYQYCFDVICEMKGKVEYYEKRRVNRETE